MVLNLDASKYPLRTKGTHDQTAMIAKSEAHFVASQVGMSDCKIDVTQIAAAIAHQVPLKAAASAQEDTFSR